MERNGDSRVVLITGGSSGIGKASAEVFLCNGFHVLINGRHKDSLQKTCEELSFSFTSRPSFMAGTIDFIQGDLSLVKDCEKIVTTVV